MSFFPHRGERVHPYLIILGVSVQEAQEFITGRLVDQPIYAREGVCIFGAGFIEVQVIYTHSQLTPSFFYHYNVGQLCGITDLPNEVCFKQLDHS